MAQFGRDQSIIVTGESGAGKTVSAKFSMKFFAAAGGGKEDGGKENVNQKVTLGYNFHGGFEISRSG